ncbi:MAG: TIGR02757 family protein [Candidatus Sumerlaeia bacterium]|nr:TIGR02757 family protein [Candidatus Sumerlaeia bacterium]
MNPAAPVFLNRRMLETLYRRYNRREAVGNDPVGFLYQYDNPADREVAGLVAALLALGNINQIHKSVAVVLKKMDGSPAGFLRKTGEEDLRQQFAGFQHRTLSGEGLAALLWAVGQVLRQWETLGHCFTEGVRNDNRRELEDLPASGKAAEGSAALEHDATILPALSAFVARLERAGGRPLKGLLPSPENGSACKRLNLFLRWMVRRDSVDPGGWDFIPKSRLVMPLDTHIFQIGRALGLTGRKQANLKAALEITAAFRRLVPDDPVRYDFALAHWAMEVGGDPAKFLLLSGRGGGVCRKSCNP